MATLPTGLIVYIERPTTTAKSPHSRKIDKNTVIHSVVHAYHPEKTE